MRSKSFLCFILTINILIQGHRGMSGQAIKMQVSMFMFSKANIAINGQLVSTTTDTEEEEETDSMLNVKSTKVTTGRTNDARKNTQSIHSDEETEGTTDITAGNGKRAGPVILVATSMYMLNKPVIGLKDSEITTEDEGKLTTTEPETPSFAATEQGTDAISDQDTEYATSESSDLATDRPGGGTSETPESISEDTVTPGSTEETTSETSESTTGDTDSTTETSTDTSESTGKDTGNPGSTGKTTSEASESTGEGTSSPGETAETSSETSESIGEDTDSSTGTTETTSETSGSTSEDTAETTEETSESTSESTNSTAGTTQTTGKTSRSTGEDTSSPGDTKERTNEVKKRSAKKEILKRRSKYLSKRRADGMRVKKSEAILLDLDSSKRRADVLKVNGSGDRALYPRNQAQADWGKNGLNKNSKKKTTKNGMPIRRVRNYVMGSE